MVWLQWVRKKFWDKDIIGKGISRGAEWHKFQLRSTFQWGVTSMDQQTLLPVNANSKEYDDHPHTLALYVPRCLWKKGYETLPHTTYPSSPVRQWTAAQLWQRTGSSAAVPTPAPPDQTAGGSWGEGGGGRGGRGEGGGGRGGRWETPSRGDDDNHNTVKPVYSDHLHAAKKVVLVGRWSLYRGRNQLYNLKHYWDITKWSIYYYREVVPGYKWF